MKFKVFIATLLVACMFWSCQTEGPKIQEFKEDLVKFKVRNSLILSNNFQI